MYKLIDSSSFFDSEEIQVSIIDFESNSLIKQAADSRIQEYATNIDPIPGKMYLHINAMGAGEFYGANRNADYFPESNLLDYYKTFETSPAHVFRHHINKDPARSIGKVLFSVYNERMHRVELIAEVDKELGRDIGEKIAMGMYPSTSMACKTPYDVCSICGNKARTRQEYCSHLSTQLGRLLPDGRKVMALNLGPLKFFDISIVIKPADVTSSILQKVAGVEVVSSADLAESEGLSDSIIKESSINKLSEFIKEIEGTVVDADPVLQNILNKVQDPDLDLLDSLRNVSVDEILNTFAVLGISPSLTFLSELLARRTLGDKGVGLGLHIDKLIRELGPSKMELPDSDYKHMESLTPSVVKAVSVFMDSSSLLPEYVEKRAYIEPGYGLGYASLGQGIVRSPRDAENTSIADDKTMAASIGKGVNNWFSLLLGIGGAALLAKWFITNRVHEELKRGGYYNQPPASSNVKIVLTKNASDNSIAFKLSKAAMEQSVSSKNFNPADSGINSALKTIESIGSTSNSNKGRAISITAKIIRKGRKLILNENKETK